VDAVDGALRDLLASMYAPGAASGVHWARGMVVIIDNTCFFHGRTAGRAAASSRRRHLSRLRILADPRVT
jgi:alpha-ketoglutarate-dependent taurine dioxygenase